MRGLGLIQMNPDKGAIAPRLEMDTAGMFHKLRPEVAEPSANNEDVAVVEALEENTTVEARAHCTCMIAAAAVGEEIVVAVAAVAMEIGVGTMVAAGRTAHWQLDPG